MPDVSGRDELERKVARAITKLQKKYGKTIVEMLGSPPNYSNIPAEFWTEIGGEMASTITPFLENIYLDQALALMQSQPIGVDWALVNQGAVDWATNYTFDLVRGINQTTMTGLQNYVSNYFSQGWTMGELESRIGNLFGPVRSEMIAVTEVTRASVEGERALANELRKEGINMVPVWQTNNDELVCPICGPKHNKEIRDNVYPPAHPRCRCWVNHKLPKVKAEIASLGSQ